MNRQPFHPQLPINDSGADQRLRRLRQQAGLSQLDLALIAGVSQRHLSCIETGRANASPSTLHPARTVTGTRRTAGALQ